jgi:tetratricopeptide (TPR) repeat protein
MKIPLLLIGVAALTVLAFALYLVPRPEQIGDALEQSGRLEDALAYYSQALRANPADDTTLVRVGAIHTSRGQPEAAIDAYRRLVELSPNDAGYHRGLAQLYEWSLRLDEAAEQRVRVAELDPGDVAVRHSLVNYYILEKKDYATAISYAEEIVAARPHDGQALTDLADLYGQTRQLDRALATYQRAQAEDPTDPVIGRSVARASGWVRQTEALIQAYRVRLAEAPADAQLRSQLAELLRGVGRSAEANEIQQGPRASAPGPSVLASYQQASSPAPEGGD